MEKDDILIQEFKNNSIFKNYEVQRKDKSSPMPVKERSVGEKINEELEFRQNLLNINKISRNRIKDSHFVSDFRKMSKRDKSLILFGILGNVDFN